jgi:hypothetical protein
MYTIGDFYPYTITSFAFAHCRTSVLDIIAHNNCVRERFELTK